MGEEKKAEEKQPDEKKPDEKKPDEPVVGKVVGYFAKIGVAAIEATAEFAVGDVLHYKGHTTDFTAKVDSMQVENASVEKASPGDEVGIKVPDRVREHDVVTKAEQGS